MPIIGHFVISVTLAPCLASLTAVNGAATSAISSITTISPEISGLIECNLVPGDALARFPAWDWLSALALKPVATVMSSSRHHDVIRLFGGEHRVDIFSGHGAHQLD